MCRAGAILNSFDGCPTRMGENTPCSAVVAEGVERLGWGGRYRAGPRRRSSSHRRRSSSPCHSQGRRCSSGTRSPQCRCPGSCSPQPTLRAHRPSPPLQLHKKKVNHNKERSTKHEEWRTKKGGSHPPSSALPMLVEVWCWVSSTTTLTRERKTGLSWG